MGASAGGSNWVGSNKSDPWPTLSVWCSVVAEFKFFGHYRIVHHLVSLCSLFTLQTDRQTDKTDRRRT